MPLALVGLGLFFTTCLLQAESKELTVAIAPFPPHVIEENGTYVGFDIDLWEEIARRAGYRYKYSFMPFADLLTALQTGRADVGVAGVTITEEREEVMDFSHPYMTTGLRILAPAQRRTALLSTWRAFVDSEAWRWLLYLGLFVVLCSHILYLAERGRPAINDRYFPGIFEAAWCILATMTTVGYGDIAPQTWRGRLVAFVVMLTGIGLFSMVLAELSSGLTLQKMTSEITGREDLNGRMVATVRGTTSQAIVQQLGARVIATATINEAVQLLETNQVDAVVFDEPVLLYYLANQPRANFQLVGEVFSRQAYGIALRQGSPLRETINRLLLEIMEDGTYAEIYRKWFKRSP